jgi:hypothetical protein
LPYVDLQPAALDQPACQQLYKSNYLDVAESVLKNYKQHRHLPADYRCPADQRIEAFLNEYLVVSGEYLGKTIEHQDILRCLHVIPAAK